MRQLLSLDKTLLAVCCLAFLCSAATERSAHATVIEFDTEFQSLILGGGPFPIPLASDPGNQLGDSVDGYGFVNSSVQIQLSSERTVNPGSVSYGEAVALDGGGPQTEPIDPDTLHGTQFEVTTSFVVYFDITLTDVDDREGHDYAGQPDGASIVLTDNGPTTISSVYEADFDKNAPNFGLFPPAVDDPWLWFATDLEIPLGGDINGNGEDDKIKFTTGTLAAGDANRQYDQLPDGTIVCSFDSAAFLEGTIVDVSTDPPFTIGALDPGTGAILGDFAGSGAITSLLETEVIPEPGSLGLLALGATGLLAWRRRRRT